MSLIFLHNIGGHLVHRLTLPQLNTQILVNKIVIDRQTTQQGEATILLATVGGKGTPYNLGCGVKPGA